MVRPAAKRADPDFFIGNRIRTCISDDVAEAKAVLRRTMSHYGLLPYYRNYWKEAGYIEEMSAIESAIEPSMRILVERSTSGRATCSARGVLSRPSSSMRCLSDRAGTVRGLPARRAVRVSCFCTPGTELS